MTVVLLAPHWASNVRVQRAANNNPPMQKGDGDSAAVKLLQQALILSGFPMKAGADGDFGSQTAAAVVGAETQFGFAVDVGIAGREVFGALDLSLRGWSPPNGAHWGGQLAATIVSVAQRKISRALGALDILQSMLAVGKFDFVTADGVTMVALRTHFKLVPPGGTKLAREEFITRATINSLISNFRALQRTLANPKMMRHSICTLGLNTAAEAPFGGPVIFGPPYSDFQFAPVAVTNIDKTGKNSLAAMMMHEATHVIDNRSGSDAAHISEFTPAYDANRGQRSP